MFTGIVQAVGKIVRVSPLEVQCPGLGLSDVAVGASIAVQGVCLTVTALTGCRHLAALERLTSSGFRTTVDVLGEAVTSPADARAASDAYVETLDALAARGLDRNVSVKLSQMGLAIDPDLCRGNVRRILDAKRSS